VNRLCLFIAISIADVDLFGSVGFKLKPFVMCKKCACVH